MVLAVSRSMAPRVLIASPSHRLMSRRRYLHPLRCAAVTAGALTAGLPSSALAQGSDELFAGDSVRVELPGSDASDPAAVERFVGSVLKVEGRQVTVIAREPPRCMAGLAHGEGPTCSLGPLIYHTVELGTVRIERRQVRSDRTTRMLLGGVAGGAALGAAGYALGPSLGFGSAGGCRAGPGLSCDSDRLPGETAAEAEERLAAEQKVSDQRRGALFFGVIGGTLGAMLGRRLSVGWVDIHPTVPAARDEPWGLSLHLPAGGP